MITVAGIVNIFHDYILTCPLGGSEFKTVASLRNAGANSAMHVLLLKYFPGNVYVRVRI